MKTVVTCPLGSQCEKVVDDHIERCMWYLELEGDNPQNGEKMRESRCAMSWLPLLSVQGNGLTLGTNASIQSLRNETVKTQLKGLNMLASKVVEDNKAPRIVNGD